MHALEHIRGPASARQGRARPLLYQLPKTKPPEQNPHVHIKKRGGSLHRGERLVTAVSAVQLKKASPRTSTRLRNPGHYTPMGYGAIRVGGERKRGVIVQEGCNRNPHERCIVVVERCLVRPQRGLEPIDPWLWFRPAGGGPRGSGCLGRGGDLLAQVHRNGGTGTVQDPVCKEKGGAPVAVLKPPIWTQQSQKAN